MSSSSVFAPFMSGKLLGLRLTSSNETEPTPNVEVPAVVLNPEVAELIGGVPNRGSGPDRDRFWHIVYRVGAVVAITALIVAAVAGVIGYSASAQGKANQRATAEQSKCINTLLGDRSGLLTSLITDLVDKSKVQSQALTEIASAATPQAAEAALALYQGAEDKFTAASAALTSYANSHPLGRC